nr:MAG TPA: hypothetical protein [Caudoviricetes sp.]
MRLVHHVGAVGARQPTLVYALKEKSNQTLFPFLAVFRRTKYAYFFFKSY